MLPPISSPDHFRRLIAVAAIAIALLGSNRSARGAEPPRSRVISAPLATRNPLLTGQGYRFEGVGSCGSSACHNGRIARDAIPGAEHAVWVSRDRHAVAYTVLQGERSRRIESLFRGDANRRPERDALCLNCHVHLDFERSNHVADYSVSDGVSCESCHGASQAWVTAHTTAGWKALAPEQKSAYGFFPTDDLVARGRMCAECHVGSTRRTEAGELVEVNHDLIAAGHPRLAFEYAAYMAMEPPHWSLANERARHPDLEARTWAIGQVLNVQASLDLLAARATLADASASAETTRHAWPELSEYGCFACHHALADPSATQDRGYPGRPGAMPWNTWYTSNLQALVERVGLATDNDPTATALDDLRRLMSRPYPEPAEAAQLATQAANGLESWLRGLRSRRLGPDFQRDLIADLAALGSGQPLDWDASAQAYLAIAAMHQALGQDAPGLRDPRLRDSLAAMARKLNYPRNADSPGANAQGNPIRDELRKVQAMFSR